MNENKTEKKQLDEELLFYHDKRIVIFKFILSVTIWSSLILLTIFFGNHMESAIHSGSAFFRLSLHSIIIFLEIIFLISFLYSRDVLSDISEPLFLKISTSHITHYYFSFANFKTDLCLSWHDIITVKKWNLLGFKKICIIYQDHLAKKTKKHNIKNKK